MSVLPESLPFDHPPEELQIRAKTYHHICSEGLIGSEDPGPALVNGPFKNASRALCTYYFSDPRIVLGLFKGTELRAGSTIAVEMHVPFIHFVCAARVVSIRTVVTNEKTQFGFRYDTLQGHIESGAEWFLINKDHLTGMLSFRITAAMKPGDFPNWLMKIGYLLTGGIYRRKWHRNAHDRLRRLLRSQVDPAVTITTGVCELGYLDENFTV